MTDGRKTLVADLFCGAGGTSTGALRALERRGLAVELVCVNHWPIAIETHKLNHPTARHYVQDLASARPAELVPEGYLDLLTASPTCTFHSRARGGKPTSDQQRADPWHIVTWLTELQVKRLLIENVPEFVDWGPVCPETGRPIKARKGEYFRAWTATIEALGFAFKHKVCNSADHGGFTTRKRFFLLARSDGRSFSFPAPTHSRDGAGDLLGGRRKWRASREIIDWSRKGRSIFTRAKPLAPKTLARIEAGALRFDWPEPFLVILRRNMSVGSLDAPLPTITAGAAHLGLAEPRLEAFTLSQGAGGAPRAVSAPLPTIVGGGAVSITEAVIAPYYGSGSGETCKSVAEPLDTVTTKPRFGLVEPVAEAFLVPQFGERPGQGPRHHAVGDPLPTVTSHGAGALVEPVADAFVISPRHGKEGAGPAPRSTDAPLPTVTAGGSQFGVVEPMVIRTDQTGSTGQGRTVGEPVFTAVTKQNMALVEPILRSADNREDLAIAIAQGRAFLAGETLYVFDILFRMLEPIPELSRAMGFEDEDTRYEFVGNKTEVTRQIGNAVEVNMAAALVGALFDGDAEDEADAVREAAE